MSEAHDPYGEGYDARIEGVSETQNPYDPDEETDDHMSWNDGWMAADEDEAE